MTPARARAASTRRAETRSRLIDAALEVVARHGFYAASVHAIADRAGYSVGAVYSNFSGKDELFFAVFEERIRWSEFERDVQALADSAEGPEILVEWLRQIAAEPARFLAFVEFWAYAVRRPAIGRKLAARLAEMRATLAAALAGGEDRDEKGLTPEERALAMLSFGRGLTLEMVADPSCASDETITRLTRALFAGL